MTSPWERPGERLPTFDRRRVIIGTAHFVSVASAVAYYRVYHDGVADTIAYVDTRLAEGGIHIGKPVIGPGEALVLLDQGRRYGIETSL